MVDSFPPAQAPSACPVPKMVRPIPRACVILATVFSKLQETQWLLFGAVSTRLISHGCYLNCNLRLSGSEAEGSATARSFFSACAGTQFVPVGLQVLQEDTVSLAARTTEQQVATLCNSCAAGKSTLLSPSTSH